MKRIGSALAALAAVFLVGCAYVPGGTDLGVVASGSQLGNVTTGDGTFENYKATGHYTGTEIGIGVGLPFLITLLELYPAASNEAQVLNIAREAKKDGADAMINVEPPKNTFTGFPFILVGIYIDRTAGTGIKGSR